jgi:hypothetical protein
VTDPALITQYRLSDPNPFFTVLLTKPYRNQVVISPHVYGPSVTNNYNYITGQGLYGRLTNSFGYLTKQVGSMTVQAQGQRASLYVLELCI